MEMGSCMKISRKWFVLITVLAGIPLIATSISIISSKKTSETKKVQSESKAPEVPSTGEVLNVQSYIDSKTNTIEPKPYEACLDDLFLGVIVKNEIIIHNLARYERKATTSDNERLARILQNIKDSAENFKTVTPPAGYEDVHELAILALAEYTQYANMYPKDLNNTDPNKKLAASYHISEALSIQDRMENMLKEKIIQRQNEITAEKQNNRPE